MDATFLGDNGKPQHFEMGCYGIGVTRLPAAAVEQNHDERGMIWPDAIAPFTVVICPIGMGRSEAVKTEAEKLYGELLALGVDVILDDRDERPGAMLADWELIGVPHRVVLGDLGLKLSLKLLSVSDGLNLLLEIRNLALQGVSLASGTTRCTSPHDSACAASHSSPVSSIQAVRALPM
jgi:hypothetical protein